MLQRSLFLWLVLLSAVAFFWPSESVNGFDPFVASKPHLTLLIVATMFCVGTLLPRDELTQLGRRWPTVAYGTCVQYTAMPLLAYLVGRGMGFTDNLLIGIVMVGCVPGAMASNVLTLAARGNVSYSVSLTTLATLVSPLVVPLALRLTLGRTANRDLLLGSSLQLATEVVLPVIAGFALCRFIPGFSRLMQQVGPTIANLCILWIIAVVVALSRDSLANVTGLIFAGLIVINLGGFAAGEIAGRVAGLETGMRRALILEIGMQNAGLGAKLSLDLFNDAPEAAIPPAAYAFGCMLTGTLLAQCYRWRSGQLQPLAEPGLPATENAASMEVD